MRVPLLLLTLLSALSSVEITYDNTVVASQVDGMVTIANERDNKGVKFSAKSVLYVIPWEKNDNNSYLIVVIEGNGINHRVRLQKRNNLDTDVEGAIRSGGVRFETMEFERKSVMWNRDKMGLVEYERDTAYIYLIGNERRELK